MRNVAVPHEECQCLAVNSTLKSWDRPNGFQFRRKDQTSDRPAVIQRLNAKPIPNQVQPPALPVPEPESKHADESLQAAGNAPLLECRQHNLGIGAPAPRLARKRFPDLLKVIDLAIKGDDEPPRRRD